MGDKGAECIIKPEYLDQTEVKNGNHYEQKPKGRNKNRPGPMKFSRSSKLCPIFNNLQESGDEKKCTFPNCSFQHDPEKYLDAKLPDISEDCHNFKTFGFCENGLSCRFGNIHIKDKKYNMVNKELCQNGQTSKSQEKNHCSYDLKQSLRKKKYDFKTDPIVDRIYKERAESMKTEESKNEVVKDENDEPESKKIKICEVDQPIETKEKEPRKKIDWQNKLYLAPLTTVGNLPFRRICKKYGADITCGEMAMTQQLLQGHQPEWALVQRHVSEDIFGIQLCGCQPHHLDELPNWLKMDTSMLILWT